MRKGESTRQRIVGQAAEISSLGGVQSLTIGGLADALSMSKSGLFAHFGSLETLQLATIDEIEAQFTREVIMPALREPGGVRRLRALAEGWIDWSHGEKRRGGCPLAAAAFEFDAQPGEMRDRVARAFEDWRRVLSRTIEQGKAHDIPVACDAHAIVFEIFGIYFAQHVQSWLLSLPNAREQARDALDRLFVRAFDKANA
ncbi:MAG: hypothetical protein K2P80_10720 [Beijerinckiaceae bacterium]|nr:hypothetical protein [Beijerinckiaceae bacterium]